MAILRQLRRSPTGISDHFRFADQPHSQCPRVDHNRDRMPESRPHIASGRSNSIDWKWAASRRHSTAPIHPANPSASGIKYDPLRYGLKPSKYRVKHFGHSTQWRTREAMACVGELLGELFPPALAVDNPGHVDIGKTHIDPHMIRPCAFARHMAEMHGAEAQKTPLSWIEQ
jgi:hypothetical protein